MTAINTDLQIETIASAQWLNAITEGGCFILAEAAINGDVPSLAESLNGISVEYSRLYWGETGRIHSSISPYLIHVTEDNWPIIAEKICQKKNWGIGIQLQWYMNAYTPVQQLSELLSHLREWTWIEAETGESRLLRLSDWKVLSTLMNASTNNEAAALFGPIAQFIYLEGDNLSAMTRATKQKTDIAHRFPQALSGHQWQAISQMAQSSQQLAYQAHLKAHHQETLSWTDERLNSFVSTQVQRASEHGFTNSEETVKYLSLSLIFGEDFVKQAWAANVLTRTQQGGQTKMEKLYQAGLNELDKEVSV